MSLYRLLGVAKSASKREIKEAYRKLALQFHPDKHAQSPPQAKAAAAAKFRQISSAYDTLADDRKRAAYDDRNQPLPWDPSQSIMSHSRNTSASNGGGRGQRTGGYCPIQKTVALGTFILLIGLSFVDAGPRRERIRKRREKEDAERAFRDYLKS